MSTINNEQVDTNNVPHMLLANSVTQEIQEESGRGCRNKKKQTDPIYCPVCSVTLRLNELVAHFRIEVDKLKKISHKSRKSPKRSMPTADPSSSLVNSNAQANTNGSESPWSRWLAYQKVKTNRQSRLKIKSKKQKRDPVSCPICSEPLVDDINEHLEKCMRTRGICSPFSDDENIDVEGDDRFEEYEWAGQKRIRASSLLDGGFASLGMGTSITKVTEQEEEEADIIVDGDDTDGYGTQQYTDQDVANARLQSIETEDADVDVEIQDETTTNSNADETRMEESPLPISPSSEPVENQHDEQDAKDVIIESLKLRVRELESRDQMKGLYKCLICMDRYDNPVVSVCCWHVHCEKCWLQTLAAKRLCPQCNMITSPSELRRIYI